MMTMTDVFSARIFLCFRIGLRDVDWRFCGICTASNSDQSSQMATLSSRDQKKTDDLVSCWSMETTHQQLLGTASVAAQLGQPVRPPVSRAHRRTPSHGLLHVAPRRKCFEEPTDIVIIEVLLEILGTEIGLPLHRVATLSLHTG